MKLSEMLTKKDYSEYMQRSAEQDSSAAARRQSFMSASGFLKKLKLEAGKHYVNLLPLELALPFNPFKLEDESYSISNPFVLPGSVTSAVRILKMHANENEELKKKLVEVFGAEEKAFNFGEDAIVDLEERKVWHKYCRIQFHTNWVQKLNTSPEKFKFGRNIGADVVLNEDGDVEGTSGVGYSLFDLESALLSIKIQQINDSYAPGGANESRPETEKTTQIDALWKNRLISRPFLLSFVRIVSFPVLSTNEGTLEPKFIQEWKKKKDLSKSEYYMKYTRDRLDAAEAVLSTKSDIHDDFIEMFLTVPDDTGDNNIYEGINRFATNMVTSPILEPTNDMGDVIEKYRERRDDDSIWNDSVLSKSIYDFRKKSDSVLLSEFKNNLTGYASAMNSQAIIQGYPEILMQIDEQLTSNIAESILTDGDTGKEISQDIISSEPVIDENTEETLGSALSSVFSDDDDDEEEEDVVAEK